jgi:hypothetical protein
LQDPLAAKKAQGSQNGSGGAVSETDLLAMQLASSDSNDELPNFKLDDLPADKSRRRKSRLANPWVYLASIIILGLILIAIYVVKSVVASFG